MTDTFFEDLYPSARRIATFRARALARACRLSEETCADLTQEALLGLWRKCDVYDSRRGSWLTFSERVVANHMISQMRHLRSGRSGLFREDPLEKVLDLTASPEGAELRADVVRVLADVSKFDRSVAEYLIGYSALETSKILGVSRATIYRAIARLRAAFTQAGYRSWRAGKHTGE